VARSHRTAQGWFRDPYGRHEARYFAEGWPTELVRDGQRESFDPPPVVPPPERLVRAPDPRPTGSSDLRRADDHERTAAFDARAAGDKAISTMIRYGAAR
jgi:hypothetical protein